MHIPQHVTVRLVAASMQMTHSNVESLMLLSLTGWKRSLGTPSSDLVKS